MSLNGKIEKIVTYGDVCAASTDVVHEAGNFNSIIDVINPETGRTAINGETLDEVKQRYPTAVIASWD